MPAEKYIKPGTTAPNLAPLPESAAHPKPRALWQEWHALPKAPLRITASGELPDTPHELDALLSAAVLRWAPAPWNLPDGEGRVVPLPLALLGIVPLARPSKRLTAWRLPVWACSTLQPTAPGTLVAVAVGHAATLQELLREVPDLNGLPVSWDVEALPLTEAETLEVIADARPMPGQAERFTPPYWYDWEAAAQGGARAP